MTSLNFQRFFQRLCLDQTLYHRHLNGYISPLAAAKSIENDGRKKGLKSLFLGSERRILPEPPQLIVFMMISYTVIV